MANSPPSGPLPPQHRKLQPLIRLPPQPLGPQLGTPPFALIRKAHVVAQHALQVHAATARGQLHVSARPCA